MPYSTLAFLNLASLALSATTTTSSALFAPTAGSTWNIELINVPDVSQADNSSFHIWDYDVLDAPNSTIQAFNAKGHPVICYFSAGTWEDWRADANEFPQVALGKKVGGWPKERWLNTSNEEVRNIMVQRIEIAQSKGCDGIDPDNVDGYDNPTGFSLTKADAVNYLQFLAGAAHDRGMSCGLKNAGGIIDQVVDIMAYAVNEQCVKYNECEPFQAFIKQNKPVFHLEYTAKSSAPAAFVKKSCTWKGTNGFSTLIKHLSLNAWTTTCPAGDEGSSSSTSSSSSSSSSSSMSSSASPTASSSKGQSSTSTNDVSRIGASAVLGLVSCLVAVATIFVL